MSKLAKSVAYPFTREQPVLPAARRVTISNPKTIVAFYSDHQRMNWDLGKILNVAWRDVKLELLTDSDISIVESAMLVESNDPDYLTNLIEYFQADQDLCDFLMIWGMEEWKHYYALRDYLRNVRLALDVGNGRNDRPELDRSIARSIDVDLDSKVADVRETSSSHWQIPKHYLPVQVLAALTVQEFLTAEFYRNHSRHTREPILAQLELMLAKDETRHEMFYEDRLQQILREEPNLRENVVAALKEFGMPGAFLLDDYEERRAGMEAAAFPTIAARSAAFVRLLRKVSRLVGTEDALRVFAEGNYFTDGLEDPRRKVSVNSLSRLLTRKSR